jgi:hypothetical protein
LHNRLIDHDRPPAPPKLRIQIIATPAIGLIGLKIDNGESGCKLLITASEAERIAEALTKAVAAVRKIRDN